jgi:DNA-binding NarL/FixJ family response regulator
MSSPSHEIRQHQTTPPPFAEPIELTIVSESQLLSRGLAALLARQLKGCAITVCPGLDIPARLSQAPAHFALLDAGTDLEQTVRLIRAWRVTYPSVALLVIELADQTSEIVACIEAGARGYTLRGAGVERVVEALLLLQRGQAACSLEIAAQVFERFAELGDHRQAWGEAGPTLTEREREVLDYLAADHSNQEIAERLVIEVRTVKHHVHNILAKLKARHRWQAVMVARERGLITR